jgi:biotin transport system substrate-specific component
MISWNKNIGIPMKEMTIEQQTAIERSGPLAGSLLQVTAAALILGVGANIKIPLFFTPVPLSLQTFVVLLMAAFLGPRKAVAGVFTYLGLGTLGLPVFVGGAATAAYFTGPTAGYLLGFVIQAFITGWLIERVSSLTLKKAFIIFAGTCAIQLLIGTAWLSVLLGWDSAFMMGFNPFVAGELLKCVMAAVVVVSFKHIAQCRALT